MTAKANLRLIDNQRAARLQLGWLEDDTTQINAVLQEASDDPTGAGVSALLFGLVDYACWLQEEYLGALDLDPRELIRKYLLDLAHRGV